MFGGTHMKTLDISLYDCINFVINELIITDYAETTIDIYSKTLYKFADFLTEQEVSNISDITSHDVTDFNIFIKKTKDVGQPLVDRTVSCFTTFFNILVQFGIILKNPIDKLNHKRQTKATVENLVDFEEMDAILNDIESNTSISSVESVVLTLVTDTAAKRDTLINLKWSDINFSDKAIILDSTKHKKVRKINMTDKLFNCLYKFHQTTQKTTLDSYVLSKDDNQVKISKRVFNNIFKKMVKKFEDKKTQSINNSLLVIEEKKNLISKAKISPYVIRKSIAALLIKKGIDVALVKNFLGLSDYKSMSKFYYIMKNKL